MRLTEVLKTKTVKTVEQEALLHDIEIFQYNKSSFYEELPLLLDYSSALAKSKAMTVGIAYNIAFKFMLAIVHPGLDINEYIKNSIFTRAEHTMELAVRKLELEGFDGRSLYYGSITSLRLLSTNDPDFFHKLASYSVTLAWFRAFEESGFFPKDLNDISVTSETHKVLKDEVEALLKKSYEFFIKIHVLDSPEHHIVLEPVIEAYGTTYQPDFILDYEMYDVHTTANAKTVPANLKKLIGAYILNKKQNRHIIKSFGMYLPRFGFLDRLEENETQFDKLY
jgi:hypothetical protein